MPSLLCTVPAQYKITAFQMMLPAFLGLMVNDGNNIISATGIKSHSSTPFCTQMLFLEGGERTAACSEIFTSLTVQTTHFLLAKCLTYTSRPSHSSSTPRSLKRNSMLSFFFFCTVHIVSYIPVGIWCSQVTYTHLLKCTCIWWSYISQPDP